MGILVVRRRLVFGVDLEHPGNGLVPQLLELLPLTVLAGVEPLAVRGVDRLGRRRSRGIRRNEALLVALTHKILRNFKEIFLKGKIQ